MSTIISSSPLLAGLLLAAGALCAIGPAFAADIHRDAPYYDRQLGVVVEPPAGVVAVQPRSTVVEVRPLGSPPLPYPNFRYPLDDAGYFFPPHPAAANSHLEPTATRRIVVVPQVPAGSPSYAHVQWCATRYNSYRASDDTFLPPRGSRRACVSPFK